MSYVRWSVGIFVALGLSVAVPVRSASAQGLCESAQMNCNNYCDRTYTFDSYAGSVGNWACHIICNDVYLQCKQMLPQMPPVVSPTIGFFRDQKSSMCIGVDGGSVSAGAGLSQFYCDSRSEVLDSQFWVPIDRGSGFFSFYNSKSGLCMGVDHASRSPGARIMQFPCDGGANQSWSFRSVGSSFVAVVNQRSGLCIGVNHASTANGAALMQFGCDWSANQSWLWAPFSM